MKTFASRWLGLGIVLLSGALGFGASRAEAQFFGLSYNSPGLSIGVNQPAYYGGGYYPGVAPVVVPRPIIVPPPVVYGPRPYYGGAYGYRGGYGHPGGYYGGPRGGYGYGPRRY